MKRLSLKQANSLGSWAKPASLATHFAATSTAHLHVTPAVKKDIPALKQDVEVPALGWMWKTSPAKEGPGSGSSPSAQTTVSNLKGDRIRPKKSLGQNFLTDDVILADIVTAAGVQPGDLVLEIGPGTGNLTKHLLDFGAQVTAIEKDDTLYARLTEEYQDVPSLKIIKGDCLRLDIPDIVSTMISSRPARAASTSSSSEALAAGGYDRPIKVVANLPYNITKEFLKSMLPMGHCVSELHIMIQDEVAHRLVDKTPGRPDYRAMNLLVQYFSEPRYRFRIPKDKYYPAPGVDGALTTFDLIPPNKRVKVPEVDGIFMKVVYQAFRERRKMLKKNLSHIFTPSQVERALKRSGLRLDTRAQDLNLKQFALLVNGLQKAVEEDKADLVETMGNADVESDAEEQEDQ